MFTVFLTLHAYIYFCLLLQAYHPHWTFKHMFRGLELRSLARCRHGVNRERCFRWVRLSSAPLDTREGANKVTWLLPVFQSLFPTSSKDKGETTCCK